MDGSGFGETFKALGVLILLAFVSAFLLGTMCHSSCQFKVVSTPSVDAGK